MPTRLDPFQSFEVRDQPPIVAHTHLVDGYVIHDWMIREIMLFGKAGN